jgi:predicted membrane-bound dolichyl-phosphate-mannose-protein mannosyltransferase
MQLILVCGMTPLILVCGMTPWLYESEFMNNRLMLQTCRLCIKNLQYSNSSNVAWFIHCSICVSYVLDVYSCTVTCYILTLSTL